MVRWVFRRDGRAITCEVNAHGTQAYDVVLIPHWDPSAAVIERFNRPFRALERLASIAQRLRDDGWVVVDHAPTYMETAA
jgi:predicted membrane-bound spermidine synthase